MDTDSNHHDRAMQYPSDTPTFGSFDGRFDPEITRRDNDTTSRIFLTMESAYADAIGFSASEEYKNRRNHRRVST